MTRVSLLAGFAALIASLMSSFAVAGGDSPTKFSNIDTIYNTRHNMTQRKRDGSVISGTNGSLNSTQMDNVRNDYRDVCVYCHTPHGSNTDVSLPLWNRTIKATTYTTYNQLGTSTLTQPVSQPGAASLSCLSCHDGQTAIDSIINMPGSGRYKASQATAQDTAFLNTWTEPSQGGFGPPATNGGLHNTMSECMTCHSPSGSAGGATDFSMFMLGTDLRNDHPVGVRFPTASTDFNTTTGATALNTFFDKDGDGHMDKEDIRLYKTGTDFRVECASCHDPHGVPSGGAGSPFNKTFLRKTNDGSGVCLTCHAK